MQLRTKLEMPYCSTISLVTPAEHLSSTMTVWYEPCWAEHTHTVRYLRSHEATPAHYNIPHTPYQYWTYPTSTTPYSPPQTYANPPPAYAPTRSHHSPRSSASSAHSSPRVYIVPTPSPYPVHVVATPSSALHHEKLDDSRRRRSRHRSSKRSRSRYRSPSSLLPYDSWDSESSSSEDDALLPTPSRRRSRFWPFNCPSRSHSRSRTTSHKHADKPIEFFSPEDSAYGWLSPVWPCDIQASVSHPSIGSQTYNFASVEHYAMAQRALLLNAFDEFKNVQKLGARDWEIIMLGHIANRLRAAGDGPQWAEAASKVYFDGYLHKVKQHPSQALRLGETGQRKLVYTSPDEVAGIGQEHVRAEGETSWGMNAVGKALQAVRALL
ncbi:hypothetical protein FA95DRAFT_965684 [Auriscalpium vulgare]|uniref:Uncharacterized protein n=1 Tax=Auriscalpium vulgare TaxID=40419 RepID=A0ACB8RXW4_9AGAM|nr:hypothetical protein FA95DRAFT_965684 [Auriscalpium vulgare]